MVLALPSRARLAAFMGLAAALAGSCADADPEAHWQRIAEAESHGWLLSVWGPSPETRFAVGGTPERGAILRFDGEQWRPMALPDDVPLLNWVYGFGADDVYVVGSAGTVLHYDGDGWTHQPTPTDQDLWGVWGSEPERMWAVGGSGRLDGRATLLRRRGRAWEAVELPELERSNVRALFKVWGSGADDVYAVGQRGAVLHWDGARWEELHVGADDDLIALWGTGPDRILAVGGRGQGVLSRWDGTRWETRTLVDTPGLNGVWMAADGTAHVVGEAGTALRLQPGAFQGTDQSFPTSKTLHAVFGGPDGARTAVGGNLEIGDGPFEGLLLEQSERAIP